MRTTKPTKDLKRWGDNRAKKEKVATHKISLKKKHEHAAKPMEQASAEFPTSRINRVHHHTGNASTMSITRPREMCVNANHSLKQPLPPPQAPFCGKLVVLLFVLTYLTGVFILIVDCWLNNGGRIRSFLITEAGTDLPPLFSSAIYAVLGSILGCGVLDVVSFHKYVAIKRDFQTPHVWGYFFAPWLAAILGLVVFALLQVVCLSWPGDHLPLNRQK